LGGFSIWGPLLRERLLYAAIRCGYRRRQRARAEARPEGHARPRAPAPGSPVRFQGGEVDPGSVLSDMLANNWIALFCQLSRLAFGRLPFCRGTLHGPTQAGPVPAPVCGSSLGNCRRDRTAGGRLRCLRYQLDFSTFPHHRGGAASGRLSPSR
jgi:hypothetical protein